MTCHGCLVATARPFLNLCHECEQDHLEMLREERRQQTEALERLREEFGGIPFGVRIDGSEDFASLFLPSEHGKTRGEASEKT
jgi:hypothetical protein